MGVFVADEQTHPVDSDRLLRLASFVLHTQRVPEVMEVSLLFVDRTTIAELNAHHMGSDGPTDVLAFPIDMPGETRAGEPSILGDVVLCPEIAAAQAQQRGLSAESEVELLVVHGLLHLLGHDHADPDERAQMFGLTDRLLDEFRTQETANT